MNNKKFIAFGIAVMHLVIRPVYGMQQDSPGLVKPGNLSSLGGEKTSRETSPETVQPNGQASRALTDSPQTVQTSRSESGPVVQQRRMTIREELDKQKQERKKALLEQKKADHQDPGVNGLIVGSPKSYTEKKLPFLSEPPVVKKAQTVALEIWAKIRQKGSIAAINTHYSSKLFDYHLKAAIMGGGFAIIPHDQSSYLLIYISNYQLLFSEDGEWVQYTGKNAPLFVIPKRCLLREKEETLKQEDEVPESDFKWRGQDVFTKLDNNPEKTRLLLSAVNKDLGKKLSMNDLKKCVIFHYPASACVGIKISPDQEIFLNYSGELIRMAQEVLKTGRKVQIFPFLDEEDELQFEMDDLDIGAEEEDLA